MKRKVAPIRVQSERQLLSPPLLRILPTAVAILLGGFHFVRGLSVSPSSLPPPPPPPPLPWTFSNAKILYQPALVPLKAARAATPDDLPILSFLGWTLGGVFCVEWKESPIGYYRETAVLSALVFRGFGIGAWASHIVVTERQAAEAARHLFGLPAFRGAVEFAATSDETGECSDASGSDSEAWARAVRDVLRFPRRIAEDDAPAALRQAPGIAVPGIPDPSERLMPPTTETRQSNKANPRRFVFESSDSVRVFGWDGWLRDNNKNNDDDGTSGGVSFTLTLPSFSGRLGEGSLSALLKYDLTLGPAKRVRLRPPMTTQVLFGNDDDDDDDNKHGEGQLLRVLGGPVGLIPCLQVDGVTVVAGTPETIGS